MTDALQLTRALGGIWSGGSGSAPCPVCQPERRRDQSALALRNEDGRLLVFCHKTGCSFRDIVLALGLEAKTPDPAAARAADAKRAEYERCQLDKARALWSRAKPISGTGGEVYLRRRGITCALPDSLRWAPDAFHGPSGRWLSAMVGEVSTGAVHRTFFEKSGERLSQNAKLMQGPCSGGAVRLSGSRGPLVVCEGIETGLSLLSGLVPEPAQVWAALSSSGMRALRLPEVPGALIVATDGDDAGTKAGDALANDAYRLGWDVSLLPAPSGTDWNDILQGEAAA